MDRGASVIGGAPSPEPEAISLLDELPLECAVELLRHCSWHERAAMLALTTRWASFAKDPSLWCAT